MSHFCVLGADGRVLEEERVATTPAGIRRVFGRRAPAVIAMEAGTHSPWVSRLLTELGHEVLVANPARLRLIYENQSKSDRIDARFLARLARFDRQLLYPIRHRSERAQGDLAVLRSRDALVRSRTALINHVRGSVKSLGARVSGGMTATFAARARKALPEALKPALLPVIAMIESLTIRIRKMDAEVERLGREKYPETRRLREVDGVGPIVALAYVLTLEDPNRFRSSRSVGAFTGLVPRRSQSGDSDPQRRITKCGDTMLRRLLVQASQHVLGRFGRDSDLRRHGLRIAERGGKNARKRAVTAVARKLSVLLHRLWRSGETYDPLHAERSRRLPVPDRRRRAA